MSGIWPGSVGPWLKNNFVRGRGLKTNLIRDKVCRCTDRGWAKTGVRAKLGSANSPGSVCFSELLHPCRARHVHSLRFLLPSPPRLLYAPFPCSRERRYVSVEAEFPAAYIRTAGFTDSLLFSLRKVRVSFAALRRDVIYRLTPSTRPPAPLFPTYLYTCSVAVETSCTYSLYKYPNFPSRCVTYTYRTCRVGRMRAPRKKGREPCSPFSCLSRRDREREREFVALDMVYPSKKFRVPSSCVSPVLIRGECRFFPVYLAPFRHSDSFEIRLIFRRCISTDVRINGIIRWFRGSDSYIAKFPRSNGKRWHLFRYEVTFITGLVYHRSK